MCYRGSRGVVPTDGIRPGQMIVKFAGGHATWPLRCACGILLWLNNYIKGTLCHVKWL